MRKQEKSKRLSRWMYIALAAVLVVALGVTAVLLWPKEEVPVSGPEAGVYYYEAELDEYVLSLLDECRFSMILGSESKQGTYTVDGETVNFTFRGEEAVGATAVLKNDVLTLTYGTSEMRFLKKIPYTVTFNANGGSAVEKVSVVNGKKVNKPSDPTKAGNVFLGWYADEALTKAYNFLTDMVTSDTTLYARWAEKPEGQPEYLVNFHMGYEAEAPAAMQTIGGKLYDLVTPEREGYTFGGWWISIYQDAERLSYQYTEDTVFDANTTLYATWLSDTTGSKLQAPQVSIDKNGAKWPAVSNASSYEVTVVNAATNKQVLKETATATVYTIPFADLDAGDYIVTVKAKANVETNDSAETVRYYKNKGLGRVSQFTVIDPATILFNAVENATDYYITVVCGNKEHNHSYFYNGNSTNFNFASCTMTEEGISFTVTATAEGYASSESETFVYKRMLEAVTGLKVDGENQTVSWNAVANAGGYVVTVTDATGEHVINANGLSCSLEAYTAGEGGITVSVVPVTNGYISPAAATVTYNKTKLATPSIIGIDDTVLSWTEVPGAAAYVVKLGNQEYRVEGTSYDFAELLDILEEHYTFRVKAVSDSSESTYSKELNATYLIMNTEISYKNNVVTWSPVIGAGYYMVQVNDEYAQRVDGSRNSFEITLTKPGINIITVTSNVTEEKAATEVYAYTVELDSRAGSSVKPVYVAMGDKINFPETDRTGYDFVAWYTTPGGPAGNGAAYSDLVFNGTGDMMLFAHWAAKSFNITFTGDGFEAIEDTKIKYDSTYTLPVPVSSDKTKMFAGWYTDIDGVPTKLTDADGNGVGPFNFVSDRAVYAYWATNVLQFELNRDGESYSVSAGLNINEVSKVYIPETHEGKPVTVVEAQGFAFKHFLREISIPDTVTLIGASAFNGCSRLENIEVYEVEGNHEVLYWSHDGGVIYKDNASGGVNYLQFFPRAKTGSYTVPEDVLNIAPMVFEFSQLSEITIPGSVAVIGANAFRGASNLEIVRFQFAGNTTGTLTIDETAFTDCNAIREFYLPAQANTVTVAMLRNMPALEKIVVEEGNIAYSSVDGMLCSADAANKTLLLAPRAKGGIVTIPTAIHNIAEYAFAGNKEVLQIVIPNHVATIGANAFADSTGIRDIIFEGNRYVPLEIGEKAFSGLKNLKTVEFRDSDIGKLDEGAVTIGAYAFAGNTKLISLTIGNDVNIACVGEYAFSQNTKLRKIVISDTAVVAEIGSYAFSGNIALREVVIHASTTAIGDGAYSGCAYITTVSFAEGGQDVTFGSKVFEDCVRLATISIPVNVSEFDSSAFVGCNSITTITVDPANPHLTAEDGVLYDKAKTILMYYPKAKVLDCSALPETLTTFGPAVFQDNPNITNMVIPAGITGIGEYAFENCINLESVTFADVNVAISFGNYAFANCGKLTAIALPAATTAIPEGLFSHTPIGAIVIPETVTSIGNDAFAYTYITEATIPAATTYVGSGAFANCQKLTAVTFAPGGEEPLTLSNSDAKVGIFNGSTAITAIGLPARTKVVEKAAFYGCTAPISFPEDIQITAIGASAFENAVMGSANLKLSYVEIIGSKAFYGVNLNTLELGNTLKELRDNALANAGLTAVTFAEGNNEVPLNISDYALAYNKLVTVKLPLRTQNIGGSEESFYTVFYGMGAASAGYDAERAAYVGVKENGQWSTWASTLTAVHIDDASQFYGSHDGVVYRKDGNGDMTVLVYCPRGKTGSYEVKLGTTKVVNRAFNATSLTEITFADYDKTHENYGKPLLSIGDMTNDFRMDSSEDFALGEVTIGGSVTLQTVRFPSTLSNLGVFAMGYTKNLTTLTFKEDGASLYIALYAITNLNNYNRTWNKTAKAWELNEPAYDQYDTGKIVVIDEVNLPPVRTMDEVIDGWGESMGNNLSGINVKKLTFGAGSTFTLLPEEALSGTMIESIVIPASVTEIGESAFIANKAMTSVTFEAGSQCTYLGYAAFMDCYSLTEFTMPENLGAISSGVFSGCDSLETVTLSKKIERLWTINSGAYALVIPANTSNIILPKDCQTMCSIDGVIFSKDQKTLMFYPRTKALTDLTTNSELAEAFSKITSIDHFAFRGILGQITLPETLEYVGYRAFDANTTLTTLHIPANVKEIAEEAFRGAKALTKVTFAANSTLHTIGESAFASCSKLTTATLPASVVNLGVGAFKSTKLTKFVVPEGTTQLEANYFSGLTSLTQITLPSTLESIGTQAFKGLTKITKITIPANVVEIKSNAFYGCTKLATVTFEEGSQLKTLGSRAFYNCKVLKAITLPDTCVDIGGYAFYGCVKLATVHIPKSLEMLGSSAFYNCKVLKTVELHENLKIIFPMAFSGCIALTSINIPASVTQLDAYAFANCTSLTTVTIPEDSQLKTLGSDVFNACIKLESVYLPDSLEKFGTGLFTNSGVKEVRLPANLEELPKNTFLNCSKLETVVLPQSLLVIGEGAFSGCGALKEVSVGSELESIDLNAFKDCTSLTKLSLPSTLSQINGNPFVGCTGLTTLEVKSEYFQILDGVLYDATVYTVIYAPVSTAGNITLPDTVREILPGAFAGTKITSIVISDYVEAIPADAFNGCTELTSVTISGNVKSIGDRAFAGCTKLTSVFIPKSVETIGAEAFKDCSALAKAEFEERNTTLTIGKDAFTGTQVKEEDLP